jgi:hypothetical protein
MSINDPIGQTVPIEPEFDTFTTRIERTVKSLDDNRAGIARWFWKGLLAFNLILASLVFWLGLVPHMI